jgi:type II secretory pathway pseudopilin PulG
MEMLVAVALVAIAAVLAIPAFQKIYAESSIAVSANNLRQLTVGGTAYLADHRQTFWKYLDMQSAEVSEPGDVWWFGFETPASKGRPEGQRQFDPNRGPLAGYVPAALRPDPSFSMGAKAFKPKYKSGYLGIGYNVLLGGSWLGLGPLKTYWQLNDPASVVVFATSAQVNTFQPPASAKNPMLEEFYGIDHRNTTVHFRIHGKAMVAFANGAAGFLPMDETTRDQKAPLADVGRFAPAGNKKYLE